MHATSISHIVEGSKPCLCRNCVYRSKPESSRDLLHGSRIDKLYYDKYLPLREKKLLEKLVRTRAVYDDIRNKILESDTDSNKNCGCVNKKKVIKAKESDSIHDIVSLVDRGELSTLDSSINLHNECCSCCDCKSKVTKVHGHIPSLEVVEDYLSKHKVIKAKSDPCSCTLKLSSEKNRLKYERKHLKPKLKSQTTNKTLKKDKTELKKPLKPIICKCFMPLEAKNSKTSISHAVKEIRESVGSIITTMGNKFQNLKKDSLTQFRERKKKRKKNDPMEDWACAPDFCIPYKCNPADCYKEIKRRIPDLDHERKIRFADEKIQTTAIKSPKVKKDLTKRKRKPTAQKKKRESDYNNEIKSAASMTNVSIAKTTSTKKSSTRTKSASSTEKRKPRKRRRRAATTNKNLPFPRECDPGMCEPGKCNPEDCAKILLRNSQATHNLDRGVQVKKPPKKEPATPSAPSSVECFCTRYLKKSRPKEPKTKKPKKPDNMKSTASTTTLPVAKITNTKKSKVVTKSTSSLNKQKHRKRHEAVSKPLPFPRECDLGMCEPGKCNPEECAKILLRNSQAAHNLDRGVQVKKRPKKEPITPSASSSVECMCKIKPSKQEVKIIKETATQPKKVERVSKKTTPLTAKVKSVQKNIERCFCTLDLKKSLKKDSKIPKADIKSTSSSSTQTQVQKPAPKTKLKKVQKQQLKVDECICITTSSTSTQSQDQKPKPKKIKITSASEPKPPRSSSPKRTKNVQTRVPKHRKPTKPTKKPDRTDYSPKSKSSPDAPLQGKRRQVVRISSSFRFDIEFYKDRNNPDTKKITSTNNSSVVTSNTKTIPTSSETETRTKEVKQPKTSRKKNKATKHKVERSEPLKRCFCTLKFHEKSKNKAKNQEAPALKETKKTGTKKVIKTYEKDVTKKTKSTNKRQTIKKLLPYECEPDFCIPGECDPHVCEKRIKMRSSKETNTVRIRNKTNSSTTSNSSSKATTSGSSKTETKSKPTMTKANFLTRCFCTKNFYKKKEKKEKKKVKKVSDSKELQTQTKKTSSIRVTPNKPKKHTVADKCLCTLKFNIKPKKERKKDNPVIVRTTETQTVKGKHKNKRKKPKRPKQSEDSSPSSSPSRQTSPPRKPRRHSPPRNKTQRLSSSPSKPRQAVKIGSQISFSIEFYRNKKQPKYSNYASTNYGARNRGDTTDVHYVRELRDNSAGTGVKIKVKKGS